MRCVYDCSSVRKTSSFPIKLQLNTFVLTDLFEQSKHHYKSVKYFSTFSVLVAKSVVLIISNLMGRELFRPGGCLS